jgi:hypothetical protein
MAKAELKQSESCFICSEYMGPFRNDLTVSTGYSEKTIGEILGKLREI